MSVSVSQGASAGSSLKYSLEHDDSALFSEYRKNGKQKESSLPGQRRTGLAGVWEDKEG